MSDADIRADGFQIRPMEERDLVAVAGIEKENFSRPWTLEDFRPFISRSDAIFLVAEESGTGRVLGYIGFYGIPDEGDITNVSVRRDSRRRGIGRALLDALIRRASQQGITRIFLEVRASNAPALALYTGAGFRRVGLRKDYYQNPTENAVIMLREEEE